MQNIFLRDVYLFVQLGDINYFILMVIFRFSEHLPFSFVCLRIMEILTVYLNNSMGSVPDFRDENTFFIENF